VIDSSGLFVVFAGRKLRIYGFDIVIKINLYARNVDTV